MGKGHSSVAKHLPGVQKAQSSIPDISRLGWERTMLETLPVSVDNIGLDRPIVPRKLPMFLIKPCVSTRHTWSFAKAHRP